jgi:hypothetical protein
MPLAACKPVTIPNKSLDAIYSKVNLFKKHPEENSENSPVFTYLPKNQTEEEYEKAFLELRNATKNESPDKKIFLYREFLRIYSLDETFVTAYYFLHMEYLGKFEHATQNPERLKAIKGILETSSKFYEAAKKGIIKNHQAQPEELDQKFKREFLRETLNFQECNTHFLIELLSPSPSSQQEKINRTKNLSDIILNKYDCSTSNRVTAISLLTNHDKHPSPDTIRKQIRHIENLETQLESSLITDILILAKAKYYFGLEDYPSSQKSLSLINLERLKSSNTNQTPLEKEIKNYHKLQESITLKLYLQKCKRITDNVQFSNSINAKNFALTSNLYQLYLLLSEGAHESISKPVYSGGDGYRYISHYQMSDKFFTVEIRLKKLEHRIKSITNPKLRETLSYYTENMKEAASYYIKTFSPSTSDASIQLRRATTHQKEAANDALYAIKINKSSLKKGNDRDCLSTAYDNDIFRFQQIIDN